MCTGILCDANCLRTELAEALAERSTAAYRYGRILTLELLARAIRSGIAEVAAIEHWPTAQTTWRSVPRLCTRSGDFLRNAQRLVDPG